MIVKFIIELFVIVLLLFFAVILIRAIQFKPHAERTPSKDTVSLSEEKIIHDMQEMIRCKTVSNIDPAQVDEAEFQRFTELLPVLFPQIHSTCEFFSPADKALLYRWKGKSQEEPIVLMSHFDVVPANEKQWTHPPFCGDVIDECIWGRGTLDTKGTLCSILEAAEQLISEGFMPEHDIYFSFSGQEEISGPACSAIVSWFEDRNITPSMVLDEGGAVVDHVFPGVTRPCAAIGIAEKGYANIEFHAKSNGGHASTPPVHTIVGDLAKAVTEVENHPFPRQLTRPVREMLDTLGRHSSFFYRLLFANLWCFEGLIDKICQGSSREINALFRTTCAITRMEGSTAFNVLPPSASVGMNLRLIGKDTVESARDYLEKVIHNPNIEVRVFEGRNPSIESSTDCDGWERICQTAADTWPEAITTPYLMYACSDSWHYCRITDRIYKFSCMHLSREERAMIHGNDERIPIATLLKAVEFYYRLIKKC